MDNENKTQETPETKEPQNLTDLAEKPKENPEDKGNETIDASKGGETEEPKSVIEKPEGVPAELWDEKTGMLFTDKTVAELAKQTKIAADFRKKISKGLKANMPEKAEDYVFEFDPELKDLKIGEDEQGKMLLGELKNIAFKNNMSIEQASGFVNGYFKTLIDKGIVKKPLSEAEQKIEQDNFRKEQKAILGDNAEKIITGAVQWIDRSFKSGIFNEEQKKVLLDFANKGATNIKILDILRQKSGEPQIPTVNAKVEGLPSDEEIAQGISQGKYSDAELAKIMKLRAKSGKTGNIPAEHFPVS